MPVVEGRPGLASCWNWGSALLLCFSAIALAVQPARADDCDVMAAKIVAAVPGTQFVRRSTAGSRLLLQHRLASEFVLLCYLDPMRLGIDSPDTFPTAAFFDVAAHAASIVSEVSQATVRSHLVKCHQEALAGNETAKSWTADLWVECHASPAFGRSEFTIRANRAPKG
jgi:hypothetical protein